MNYEFNGLPLHILLVHGVVVLLPLAALCTILTVLWPVARRRLGIVTPIMGLVQLILVFVAQQAGEWLLVRVGRTALITAHADQGLALLPWAWGLFGVSVLAWLWHRFAVGAFLVRRFGKSTARILTVVAVLVALAVCVGATIDVVVVGEAGARAIWQGSFSPTPVHS